MFDKEGSFVLQPVFYAIAAVVLYALMPPIAKLLQIQTPPVLEAGLLYLGAGIGMSVIYMIQKGRGVPASRPPISRTDARYVLAMIVLDMLAPILLLLGLTLCSPETVSLLNNFEIAATTLLAVLFFHERAGKRLLTAIGLITLSCILLSLDQEGAFRLSPGAVFVLLACVCWGLENNCTSSLSEKDTRQIVIIKGLGSGSASLILSLLIREPAADPVSCLLVMVLGFLSIGLSVYFYVLAQSRIGAARTSAFYAVAPFIGVFLSLVIFRKLPGRLFWLALMIMAAGVYTSVQDTMTEERMREKAENVSY